MHDRPGLTPLLLGGVLALLPAAVSFANDYQPLVRELQAANVSITTLAALVQLDKQPELKVGYGLCEAGDGKFCKQNGSVGYGLCEIAGAPLCKVNGSLGYGLCALSGERNCDPDGSVGYGICQLTRQPFCKP